MLNLLTSDGTIDPAAFDAASTAPAADLLPALGDDGLNATASAWILGARGEVEALRAAIPEGRLDLRQNGYHALAVAAAHGKAPAWTADFLVERIAAEIARARSGGTGLADQALRALAVLGHPRFAELVQEVMDGDRFCDRFELDRLRGSVSDNGRDRTLLRELSAPWTTVFADNLPKEVPPAPAAAAAPAPAASESAPLEAELEDPAPAAEGAEGEVPPEPAQIDWPAFEASPEFTALAAPAQNLVRQLGPLLEQLAAQAIRAMLADLSGQELAALLLQVLPQALQPQHVQMALHPHALNGYQALFAYLHRAGIATQGDSLVQGVKLVRKQMREQMRRSGMLGGPDYSDPDEAKGPAIQA